MKKQNIVKILIFIIIFILFLLSLLIKPYRLELDLIEKQINHNAVLVLRLIYIVVFIMEFIYFVSTKFTKKLVDILALLILVYSLIKFTLTFFL
jgi:hypothetical protein